MANSSQTSVFKNKFTLSFLLENYPLLFQDHAASSTSILLINILWFIQIIFSSQFILVRVRVHLEPILGTLDGMPCTQGGCVFETPHKQKPELRTEPGILGLWGSHATFCNKLYFCSKLITDSAFKCLLFTLFGLRQLMIVLGITNTFIYCNGCQVGPCRCQSDNMVSAALGVTKTNCFVSHNTLCFLLAYFVVVYEFYLSNKTSFSNSP